MYLNFVITLYCSESFTARAPKRKLVVKSKNHQLTLLRQSISSRPPATLPRAANINLDDSGEYASIDSTNGIPSDNFSWLNDEAAYDYVRRVPFNFKFLNPKSDSAKLTEGMYIGMLLYKTYIDTCIYVCDWLSNNELCSHL